MTSHVLCSAADAHDTLAQVLGETTSSAEDSELRLEIREDRCFRANSWVSVGTVSLHPEQVNASVDGGRDIAREQALRHGFYEWKLSEQETLTNELIRALAVSEDKRQSERTRTNAKEVAKAVAHVAIRCGLANPIIDAIAVSEMPYRKPVNLVMDTSAVLQGGLDFAARHLTPAARIKIPAIVHMEVLNFVERYFSQRRKGEPSAQMLLDHVLSQGAQRVLLRLELLGLVERSPLGADPLRGVVQPDSDAEDKRLGLQTIQRSFADRLIVETAIQQRDGGDPYHPVMLMTSDQGLARMALAEGIKPIYFDSNATYDHLGATLSGVTFVPFVGTGPRTHSIGLTDVLWELAVTFGASRVVNLTSGSLLEVAAVGDDLPWQAYHSEENLLWTRTITPASESSTSRAGGARSSSVGGEPKDVSEKGTKRLSGSYSFNVSSMVGLMVALDGASLTDQEGIQAAQLRSKNSYDPYYRFLIGGGLAERRDSNVEGTGALTSLVESMAALDHEGVRTGLSRVPSFGEFLEGLVVGSALTWEASAIRKAAFPNYCALAELCCAGVRFLEQGIYGTPENPNPADFVELAISSYEAVRSGEEYALTGAWLEHLARHHGIHPIRARQRLSEAHQGKYLRRFFEGSTPDTRYESRTLHVLQVEEGVVRIRRTNLYHGDFLMPGRASVSIRLSGVRK